VAPRGGFIAAAGRVSFRQMGVNPENPHQARFLSEERRLEYMTVIASVVHSDGHVDDVELEVMRQLGEAIDLPSRQMPTVIDAARSPDLRRVEAILASFRDDPIRFALLTDAILVAFADEKVAAGETEQIAEFADALGISTVQAVAIAKYVESSLVDVDRKDLAKALEEGLADAASHVHPPRGVRWLYRKLTGGRNTL
jgi:uncharacterized tellurite resistance protein B-like protein